MPGKHARNAKLFRADFVQKSARYKPEALRGNHSVQNCPKTGIILCRMVAVPLLKGTSGKPLAEENHHG